VMSFLGIWALAGGACGYAFRELKLYERLILFACIPLTIQPNWLWNTTGIGIIVIFSSLLLFSARREKDKDL